MTESTKGWWRDPFGRHEFRYFNGDGRPTNLVGGGGVRPYDAGPGEVPRRPMRPKPTPQLPATPTSPAAIHSSAPTLGAMYAGTKWAWGSLPTGVSGFLRTPFRSGWRKPVIGVVICGLLALGGEVATASTSNGPAPSVTLQQGVYVGPADPSGVASFAATTQTDPAIASDYLPTSSGWDGMDGSGGELSWILANGWTGSGFTVSLGVPMIPTWPDGGAQGGGTPAGTLADGAAGDYDNYFVALGKNLVAAGEANIDLRLGWEFDGGWYDWSATNPRDEASYAEYFRQIVDSMRSVPGEHFKFVWNPDAEAFGGEPGYNVTLAYPGSQYVDYIGVDAYDQTWVTPQTPQNEWNETTFPELTAAQQFAQSVGRPLAVPEWGVMVGNGGHGLGDDPLYVNNMINWMQDSSNDVAYESYFDYDGSNQDDKLTDGYFPNSLRAFTNDFNGSASTWSPPSTSTTTTTAPPRSTTSTTSPPSSTTTTAAPLGGDCTSPTFSTSDAEGTKNIDGGPEFWWVDNDAWNGSHGPQSISACNQSSWFAVSNQPNNGGQVETYPNTEYDVGGRQSPSSTPISGWNSITSTFAYPSAGGWDAAYDLWLNNWSTEIMIWNQWAGSQSFWPNKATITLTLDGVGYKFINNGGELMFFRDTQVSSGSVDILAAFNWLVSQGIVKATAVPTQLEYGVEVCYTSGSETFPMTGLTFNLS
jgi:hypothetical protein